MTIESLPTIVYESNSYEETVPSYEEEKYEEVPVIDLSNPNDSEIISQIATACQTFGFFQIINHGIPSHEITEFQSCMKSFFTTLPQHVKDSLRRNERNSRGYFDNELTKQKLDWKEALDVGVPGSRDWTLEDDDPSNACLDGYNQFPDEVLLPNFRSVVIRHFQSCHELSHRIATYMSLGLGVEVHDCNSLFHDSCDDYQNNSLSSKNIIHSLYHAHTSYLRLNHYPICPSALSTIDDNQKPLGISPHTDAGFLTVLIQDDDCHSLQVAKRRPAHDNLGTGLTWVTVKPVKGALTINTGDMCCIWSNGRYKAPLHRVLASPEMERFSAPFFYNPPYDCAINPVVCDNDDEIKNVEKEKEYVYPCIWGYFRAVRFAGDLTDLGTEIQISDYAKGSTSSHIKKQEKFIIDADFHSPFSVERYRPLLSDNEDESTFQ